MHGGVEKEDLKKENLDALKKGLPNLDKHIENVKKFGLELVVAINPVSYTHLTLPTICSV